MIKAAIFDMDGVLIDSEPFWQESEIEVFDTIGLKLTHEMCRETTGLRIDHAVEYWLKRHEQEHSTDQHKFSPSEFEERIVEGVINRIQMRGEPMAGLDNALAFFKSKGLQIALASSSSYRIISAVMEKLRLHDRFSLVYSAEEEQLGKPHPGVYLTVAGKLGVKATECVAIEDSLMGVIAAKAARMKCVAVPEPASRNDPRFTISDFILESLLEINDELWSRIVNPRR
jgi:HAD superfamily hydrolase (TIGR01509 family)